MIGSVLRGGAQGSVEMVVNRATASGVCVFLSVCSYVLTSACVFVSVCVRVCVSLLGT